MNVNEAMAYASKDKCFWTGEVHTALETLAAEIKRLRAELAAAGDGDTWREACGRVEAELAKVRSQLADAKAASVVPVKLFWCYESNGCDILVSGMSDDDSTKFGNWLNQRMKDTTPPTT